jgi:uncharacterized membrane protein YhhN
MTIFLIAAFAFTALETAALWKKIPHVEYITKPAIHLTLLLWLWVSTRLNGAALWFGLGILLLLAAELLLMQAQERLAQTGLSIFLLAHLAYLIGFNIPIPKISGWEIFLAVMVGLGSARIMRRILNSVAARKQNQMRMPVILYSAVILFMLLSAMMKITDPNWGINAGALVSLGAFLFYLSDIILAWQKFVAPMQHGRIYQIGTYHLGQITLIAGIVTQLGN